MKDISLSFKSSYIFGIEIKEDNDVLFQAINDCLKTRYTEVLYSPNEGSYVVDYIKPNLNVFQYLSLRDEIFDALMFIDWIEIDRKDITISKNETLRRYEVTCKIYDTTSKAYLS